MALAERDLLALGYADLIESGPAEFLAVCGRVLDRDHGDVPLQMWPHLRSLLATWTGERKVIVLKGRQLGVSWLVAGYALWVALARPGANILLLSQGQAEASDLLGKLRYMVARLPFTVPLGRCNDSLLEITNGSRVRALPATRDAGRSEHATLVICDEYAYFEYAEDNLAAISPTVSAGGQLLLVSTANGIGGAYARLWREAQLGRNDFVPVFVPWDARPGRDAAWLAEQMREISPQKAKQEYPSSPAEAFLVSGRPVFTVGLDLDPLLRRALPPAGLDELDGLSAYRAPRSEARYWLGADPAEGLVHGDASCAVVLEQDGPGHFSEVAHLHERVPPDRFAEHLHILATAYPGLVGVERNNHGGTVLLRLRQLLMQHRAPYSIFRDPNDPLKAPTPGDPYPLAARAVREGWNTTSASKPVLIDELEQALRMGWLGLGTPELVDELRMYRHNDNGSTSAPQGQCDDRVIALGLAYQMRKYLRQAPYVEPEVPRTVEFHTDWYRNRGSRDAHPPVKGWGSARGGHL